MLLVVLTTMVRVLRSMILYLHRVVLLSTTSDVVYIRYRPLDDMSSPR